jgi:formylglycine-generating enzyme required for sulfatase activity
LKEAERTPEEFQELYSLVRSMGIQYLPELVYIPAGPFLMGSSDDDESADDNEKPQHTVELSEYLIGKYPVTNREYQAYLKDSNQTPPKHWDGYLYPDNKNNHPLVQVSWDNAQAYCQWLSKKTGMHYSLPVEAQWEKAARGTDGRVYPWGDEWDAEKCNTSENGVGDTTPVGHYSPGGDSPYGCADMAGNVWEWCQDFFESNAYKNREDGVKEPQGPERGNTRSLRGGSWSFSYRRARVADRGSSSPYDSSDLIGFRVLLILSKSS